MKFSTRLSLLCAAVVFFGQSVLAQVPRTLGNPDLQPLVPGSPEHNRRSSLPCNNPFRTYDGSCSNPSNPLSASTNMPHFSYFRKLSSTTPTGEDRRSAREISNIVASVDDNIPNRRRINELCVLFGQFLDHDLALTPLSEVEMPIEVGENDTLTHELEFRRSTRGFVGSGRTKQRPINSLSSVIDLSTVYGSDEERSIALRTLSEGKLKTSTGDFLPLNTGGISNQPSTSAKFFVAGDIRCNEHPILTTVHTLFLREHNVIADELLAKFPSWDDEALFQHARAVNIAQFQKIVYEEFIPTFTGRRLPRYRGFKRNVDPTVSNLFSTAALRIGHTLVGNTIKRKGPGNSVRPDLEMAEMFFRSSMDYTEVEEFIRGAANSVAQEVDTKVVSALRNFLFTKIPEEEGIDLIALNIQRGRDHALPAYNDIRRKFRIPRARTFAGITRDPETQRRLAEAYDSPNDVDAWIGLSAEKHIPGSSLGRTLVAIWMREFGRLRDGDQFFYLGRKAIPAAIRSLPRVRNLFRTRSLFRDIILRNTNVQPAELPGTSSAFKA